jgi:hypothetical protein
MFATAILVFALGAGPTQSIDRSTTVEQVNSDRPDIVATYNDLQKKTARDRAHAFGQLDREMQSAVWRHHLANALANHREFTAAQREVIDYALRLLSPDLFGIQHSDPAWHEKVAPRLLELETRAKDIFPPTLARELFAQLGPDAPAGSQSAFPQQPSADPTHRPQSKGMGDVIGGTCQCSTLSDYCDTLLNYGSGSYCNEGFCFKAGDKCGTLLLFECDGMCMSPPQPL